MQIVNLNEMRKQTNTMKESLRELRTNIRFCGDDIKSILFTSVIPNEGKSTVVMDFARSLAEAGNKVLVVDSDMRKSVLVGRYRAKTEDGSGIVGLSHFLSGQKSLEEVMYQTQIPNLMLVFAGPAVINPTELLENKYFSDLMHFMRDLFDYVLVDCAPLGAAIDAAVIARECDGAVLVISQGAVSSRAVSSVKKQLEASGVRILGAVLNKVDMRRSGYYGKYYGGYYGSYYGKYYGKYYGRAGKALPIKSTAPKDNLEQDMEEIKKVSMAIAQDIQYEREEKDEKAENGEKPESENINQEEKEEPRKRKRKA